MTIDPGARERLGAPRYVALTSLGVALLTPFMARLPLVPIRGWEWFADYLVGPAGLLFFSAFNLIPGVALFAVGKASRQRPTAFWFAVAAALGFLLWAHGSMNLRSSSTAAIGLIFIPIYATGAVVGGWLVGLLAHSIVRTERGQRIAGSLVPVVAALLGVAVSVEDAVSTARVESRFPVVSVKEVPLAKRNVFPCCAIGRVEVLSRGEFDAEPGEDLLVFGAQGVAILDPHTYAIKDQRPFQLAPCDRCVHMHPYLVPRGPDGFLVATSNGLQDGFAQWLWENTASGFSRVVPVRTGAGVYGFAIEHHADRIEFRAEDGRITWAAKAPVESVGVYRSATGEEWPFAVVKQEQSREVRVFDGRGSLQRTVALPPLAMHVESIDWPGRGRLLVGTGGWFGVLDPSGKEILSHEIRDTSFRPYHGPEGAAVQFDKASPPYLAVLAHGSSGYARSVLLVFDPKGRLVWQEELAKVRSVSAVPRSNGGGEVLLVGGSDGVLEYTLATQAP